MLESPVSLAVRRLAVTPACPLYFWSLETLPRRTRDGAHEVYLKDGVYLVNSKTETEYLLVEGKTASPVSESAALLALGAFDLLTTLELEDAAVSLMAGELLYARNQWVRWRYP